MLSQCAACIIMPCILTHYSKNGINFIGVMVLLNSDSNDTCDGEVEVHKEIKRTKPISNNELQKMESNKNVRRL